MSCHYVYCLRIGFKRIQHWTAADFLTLQYFFAPFTFSWRMQKTLAITSWCIHEATQIILARWYKYEKTLDILRANGILGTLYWCVSLFNEFWLLFWPRFKWVIRYVYFREDKYIAGDEYIETINADGEFVDASGRKLSNQHIVCIDENEYRHQIEIDEYNDEQLEEDALDTTTYERIPTIKADKSEKNVFILSAANSTASSSMDQSQSSRQQSKYNSQPQQSSAQNDPDERFLLSCAPILKRLPNKKNALARLKIQQLLFDIEFDEYNETGQWNPHWTCY